MFFATFRNVITFQCPFHTRPGQSLATEDVKQLRNLVHIEVTQDGGCLPRDMRERFREAGEFEQAITCGCNFHQTGTIILGSQLFLWLHTQPVDLLRQRVQLLLDVRHVSISLRQKDVLLPVLFLLVLEGGCQPYLPQWWELHLPAGHSSSDFTFSDSMGSTCASRPAAEAEGASTALDCIRRRRRCKGLLKVRHQHIPFRCARRRLRTRGGRLCSCLLLFFLLLGFLHELDWLISRHGSKREDRENAKESSFLWSYDHFHLSQNGDILLKVYIADIFMLSSKLPSKKKISYIFNRNSFEFGKLSSFSWCSNELHWANIVWDTITSKISRTSGFL